MSNLSSCGWILSAAALPVTGEVAESAASDLPSADGVGAAAGGVIGVMMVRLTGVTILAGAGIELDDLDLADAATPT